MRSDRKVRVTDRMRLAALAAEISTTRASGKRGRRVFRPATLRVQVWHEGFTVSLYRGRECVLSTEPHVGIEEALRALLTELFGGRADG